MDWCAALSVHALYVEIKGLFVSLIRSVALASARAILVAADKTWEITRRSYLRKSMRWKWKERTVCRTKTRNLSKQCALVPEEGVRITRSVAMV